MASNRKTPVQRRDDAVESDEHTHQHQIKTGRNNSIRIKIDHLKTLSPLTERQSTFLEAYNRGDYFIGCFGSAGTGKTTLPLYKGIEEVLSKDNPFKQVVVVRSAVATRDIGFLPGTQEEKEEMYELPYIEISAMLFDRPDAWVRLKEQGYCRFLTTTALRGISIDDSIIIVDEVQNLNWGEVNTVMGRIGHRSKIIFCGDFKQSDLTKTPRDSTAFHDFVKVARDMPSFTEIYYTPEDIVRSSLTRDWIMSCERNDI